ncbi:MAG: tyrosine-type recombinase/integrase, partial [Alkaliphilus sp.]
YGCGLRISEAVNLTVDDVKLGEGVLFINDTKFGKERLVPEVILNETD